MQTLCPRSVYSAVFNWYHGNRRSAQGLGRHIRTFLWGDTILNIGYSQIACDTGAYLPVLSYLLSSDLILPCPASPYPSQANLVLPFPILKISSLYPITQEGRFVHPWHWFHPVHVSVVQIPQIPAPGPKRPWGLTTSRRCRVFSDGPLCVEVARCSCFIHSVCVFPPRGLFFPVCQEPNYLNCDPNPLVPKDCTASAWCYSEEDGSQNTFPTSSWACNQ